MLQQLLDKNDIIVVIDIDLRCEELPKAVRADVLVTGIVYYFRKVFLYAAFCDREDDIILIDTVIFTVPFDIGVYRQRNGERPLLLISKDKCAW